MTKAKLIFAAAVLTFFVSCASDDTTNKQTKQELGTEGLTSFVEDEPTTRTTAEYDGSGLNFFWTAGDRLWVNNTTATPATLQQDSKNNINNLLVPNPIIPTGVKRAAKAKFWFSGTFTASSYPVRYTGKNGTKDKVTIKAQQTQTIPNDASHIAEDGDCGVATATKPVGTNQYHFTLNHKAAYVTFLPYTSQSVIANAKIQKIKVLCPTKDVAGTYTINDAGTLSSPTVTSKSIELTVNNFSIPTTATPAINAATMVIAPGTYTNLNIEYTLHDPVSNVTGTITKTYPSVTFIAGRNKKVSQVLQVPIYESIYYMWDSKQEYWYGHRDADGKPDGNYATSNADVDRWYNEGSWTLTAASHSAVINPNINEAIWYVEKGDAHWDGSTLWSTAGHLYLNGAWVKKLSVIAAENSKNISDLKSAAPNGTDYASPPFQWAMTSGSMTLNRPLNTNNYFFLPCLGGYNFTGTLSGVGMLGGSFWISTAYAQTGAYFLAISTSDIQVNGVDKRIGKPKWPGE